MSFCLTGKDDSYVIIEAENKATGDLNNRYHVQGLNRNKFTGTFGFNTVNGLTIAVDW